MAQKPRWRLGTIVLRKLMRNWRDVFFFATLLLFVAEAAWLAFHAAFPMAFDEGYHVGLIRFFSHHLNPIITSQDPSTYSFGNIVHNSSWLYHWLLSFPDRVLALTHSEYIEVVGLRCINIGMAVGSLLILHRLLRHLRLGYGMRTFVMLLVAFTPVFTALAAQVNYDNLVVLLTLAATYYLLFFIREIGVGKPSIKTFAKLLNIVLLGTLVKFSFLPVLAAVLLIITYVWSRQKNTNKSTGELLARDFSRQRAHTKYIIVVMTFISVGLFATYYGQNLVRYRSLTPTCNQVLSTEACGNYYAWARNNQLAQNFDASTVLQDPISYTYHWGVTSWYHLYAEIIPTGGIAHIAIGFYAFLLVTTFFAGITTLVHIRQLIRRYPLLVPLLWLCGIYVGGLWLRNYHDYRQLGEAVAVQGRYLVPILGFYYLLLTLGVHESFRKTKALDKRTGQRLELLVATMVVVAFVWFGGIVRYVSEVLPEHQWLPPSKIKEPEVAVTLPTNRV